MNKEELLVSLCQEAIRIPSMSGHEKEVAGLLKKTMIDYGFDEVNIDKYGSVSGHHPWQPSWKDSPDGRAH